MSGTMELKGVRQSDRFTEKLHKLAGERRRRLDATVKKIQLAWLHASTPADLPQPLNRPSNTKPFRRAEVDQDLRLYWWIDSDRVLVLHDICDHTEASKYRDTHK